MAASALSAGASVSKEGNFPAVCPVTPPEQPDGSGSAIAMRPAAPRASRRRRRYARL